MDLKQSIITLEKKLYRTIDWKVCTKCVYLKYMHNIDKLAFLIKSSFLYSSINVNI